MENLKRRSSTAGILIFFGIAALSLGGTIFLPRIGNNQSLLAQKSRALREQTNLLAHQEEINSAWRSAQTILPDRRHPEEALNQWVKALLDEAQKEGITF